MSINSYIQKFYIIFVLNNNSVCVWGVTLIKSAFGRTLTANCGPQMTPLKRHEYCQKTERNYIFFHENENKHFSYTSEYIRLLNGK